MLKPCILIISSLTSLDKFTYNTIAKEIEEGRYNITNSLVEKNKDYSDEAKRFLEKRKPEVQKDINDIMYEVIGKEIQEGRHDK